MKPLDLIGTARRLARRSGSNRPRQSDLKRSISTAYYALFHTMCRNCADCLIGGTASQRSLPAWRQAYRAVEHGHSKAQCGRTAVISKFPKDVEDFANTYREFQAARHAADYDPFSNFYRTDVLEKIDAAEDAIKAFQKAPIKDRGAFAAWTAMKTRSD